MDRYYYLASTLLTPVFGQKPPVSFAELKETCARLAAEDDRRKLESVSIAPPGKKAGAPAFDFLERFWERETSVRNEIARQRAERLGRKDLEREAETGPGDHEARQSAQRALAAEDPLQAEISLEKDRWDWIEARSAGHTFDEVALAAYALRILILERLAGFTEEEGESRYDSMYGKILSGSERLVAPGGAA